MSTGVISGRPEVDLLDPTFHVGDPHPAYRWMRANEPVYRDTNGIWCVTRMEHVRDVERHATSFVSSRGYRSVWTPSETSMISKDDPVHTEQRRLVADRFTPRAVGALEGDVRQIVTDALGMVDLTSQFEVVDTIAARLPAMLTCRLIGWPDSHWREVSSWSERLMRIDTLGANPAQLSDTIRAVFEMAELAAPSVEARRGCPADDLLSRWANGTVGGRPMTLQDINSELGLVIPGGAETTRTTLARALILFSERPDLWEPLAADPSGIPRAVEELLRWITPLNNMFRTAVVDAEIGGVPISPGDRVALVYPSANRDESVFADPDDLDLDRDPNPHISFGFGTHFCLGAHVARLSLRVALEELAARFTNLRPASAPRYEANVFVKAVERFDLAFDRR
jgi:cytochrome P450 family 142 subfamily A polypeptide 1